MVEETEANNLNDVAKITQLYVARVGVQNKVFCLLILICSLWSWFYVALMICGLRSVPNLSVQFN